MNYIIFRQDGSVEQINLTEIITQGDNLVDDIFIAVEGYTDSDFQCRAVVERPDNFVSSLTAVTATFNGYNGYKVTLTSVETQLAGELKVNFVLADGDVSLWTYQIRLTVNRSGYVAEYTSISVAQYQNLLTTISTLQAKFSQPNVRGYVGTCDDYSDLALGQLYLVKDNNGRLNYGEKTSGAESLVTLLKRSNDDCYNLSAYNLTIYGGTAQGLDVQNLAVTGTCSLPSTTTHSLYVHHIKLSRADGAFVLFDLINKQSTAMTIQQVLDQFQTDGLTTGKHMTATGLSASKFNFFDCSRGYDGAQYVILARYYDSSIKQNNFATSDTIADNITSL